MPDLRSTRKLPRQTLWLLALLVAAVVLSLVSRARKHIALAGSKQPEVPAGAVLDSFPNSLPKQGGPAGYVTSITCKECHAKQFETWWRSYHRQMTQAMNTNTVQAKFDGAIMETGGARFTLHESANRYWVDIQGLEELEAARLTNGPLPAPNRL